MTGYETVVASLQERDLTVPSWGSGTMARCPAHEDNRASLKVDAMDDGGVLIYCHAGCPANDVLDALGLRWEDLRPSHYGRTPVAQYIYTDEKGNPLVRVTRFDPKGFMQEHATGYGLETKWNVGVPKEVRRVLYNLPAVLEAASQGATIFYVEGEKDAEGFGAFGHIATTSLGGAGKWREDYAQALAGARVVVVADVDDTGVGQAHAEKVCNGLRAAAIEAKVVFPLAGKDSTDHFNAGFLPDQFTDADPGEERALDGLQPFDWQTYEAPATEWLLRPHLPAGRRVLAYGAAGSLKSLWAMWVAARLSREGRKVAYFSLEMPRSDVVQRLRSLSPDPRNFHLFEHLELGSEGHGRVLRKQFQGYALIVVDSWSAAWKGRESVDGIAALDNEWMLPLIEETGATILILDNTGHSFIADSGKAVKMDHARGSSAKQDKTDIAIWFDRPDETDNYRTRIVTKKMRLDEEWPEVQDIWTARNQIEFFHVRKEDGAVVKSSDPVWDITRDPAHDAADEGNMIDDKESDA